jgi:ATP-binding cassette subfamily B protein
VPYRREPVRHQHDRLVPGQRGDRAVDGAFGGGVPARTLAAIDPGHALATLTLGLDQAMAIADGAFEAIFGGLLKGAACIVIVALIDWRIALVSLAFLPVTAAYVRQSRKISARATPRMVRAQAEGASRFYEYVESVALLRT